MSGPFTPSEPNSGRRLLYFFEEYLAKPGAGIALGILFPLTALQYERVPGTLALYVAVSVLALVAAASNTRGRLATRVALMAAAVIAGCLAPVLAQTLLADGGKWVSLGFAALALSMLTFLPRKAEATPADLGLAATGIVIESVEGADYFVLIMNRNLRSGAGLWVPPGGHFSELASDPVTELIAKVKLETAHEVSAVDTSDVYVRSQGDSFSTQHTSWWTVPAFVLNEDLHGRCSHQHLRHLDLVYLLRAERKAPGPHKYGVDQQVHIPVRECLATVDSAQNSLLAAVRDWEKNASGKPAGIAESISVDVVQRLHLAAVWLNAHAVSVNTSTNSDARVVLSDERRRAEALISEAFEVCLALNPVPAWLDLLRTGEYALAPGREIHLTCSVLVVDQSTATVLILERDGLRLQPGGHCDIHDESLQHAAARELLEECGIDGMASLKGPFNVDMHSAKEPTGLAVHLDFRFQLVVARQPSLTGDQAHIARWISMDEARLDPTMQRVVTAWELWRRGSDESSSPQT